MHPTSGQPALGSLWALRNEPHMARALLDATLIEYEICYNSLPNNKDFSGHVTYNSNESGKFYTKIQYTYSNGRKRYCLYGNESIKYLGQTTMYHLHSTKALFSLFFKHLTYTPCTLRDNGGHFCHWPVRSYKISARVM